MEKPTYSGRIAVVGMAVQYAGSRDKDEFWETLTKNEIKTKPMAEKRMGTKRKSLHLVDARPKYADTFNNDRYGTIDTEGGELEDLDNEHDLLLKLAKDALEDMLARRKNPNQGKPIDLRKYGVVSGCLSFPSDRLQGELLNLYQAHLERELPKLAECAVLDDNRSPWSRSSENDVDPKDKRFYMDPATFVADELKLGGVHYSVDAACASALYVLKLASDHLLKENSDVDAMLCGGVCFPEPLFILTGFSCFHAMPLMGGTSMPLKKGTEGLTPGEGGSILVLKRYEDAVRDGDEIYGSLLGCRLNNSGQGQPLAPNKDSQTACLAECYQNIGLNPHMVQYVECHATGTPLGDVSECEAMYRVFEGRVPRFGSTKGNFGHTLVAAGFAGAAKVLLAMNKGSIPPTPGVDAQTAVDPRVLMQNPVPWPDVSDGRLKRAGLSAFGFGGTNAHAVFEEAKGGLTSPTLPFMAKRSTYSGKMSIIGIAAHFGSVKSADELERCIYEGGDASCELPPKRWRFFSEDSAFAALVKNADPSQAKDIKPPRACYVGDVDVDYKRIKTTLILEDQLLPQQLLALSTIEDALADSNMQKGGRVAVLVGLGTDLELYRHRGRVALRERLSNAVLGDKDAESKLMDYVHDKGTSTSYTSYIGNLIATRISSQWKFTGPSFTVTEGSNSVFRCIQLAQMMLQNGDCDAVVVAGVDLSAGAEAMYVHTRRSPLDGNDRPTAAFEKSSGGYYPGEGCGAFVIKRNEDLSGAHRVYCSIDAMSCAVDPKVAAEAALKAANVKPAEVDLIELSADNKQLSIEEIKRLGLAYSADIAPNSKRRQQCVSTVKANVGHTGYASGAAAVIKAALCLYNRYLPCTPRWEEPIEREMWDKEARTFYVCPDSRAWVKNEGEKRVAAVSGASESGSAFHLLLSEVDHEQENRACSGHLAAKLIILRGVSGDAIVQRVESELLPKLKAAKNHLELEAIYRQLLHETIAGGDENLPYALSVVAPINKLLAELEAAATGVKKSLISKMTWTSPAGSTFTPDPLRSSKIAFMYGDGAVPYGGLGREIWRAFPWLHEACNDLTHRMWEVPDDDWNPRCVTLAEHSRLRKEFSLNQVEMFRSGVFFSTLFTWCCTKIINLQPKAAFGLSLGEISMLFAFSRNNSKKSDILTSRLTTSDVWTKEIAGKMTTLRKAWGVSMHAKTEEFWQGAIVRGTKDQVVNAIAQAGVKHVRPVIVNDDKTVLICGFPAEVQKVGETLGKGSLLVTVPQGMVGHCPEVLTCVPGIEHIHEHVKMPDVSSGLQLFSSQSLRPLQGKEGDDIHTFVSAVYTSLADFPATANAVYNAGFDVFVEVGPNSHRTAAVDSILQGKRHVACSFDRQGRSSYEQVLRMLAVLATHRTPGLSLKKFFPESSYAPLPAPNPLLRNVVVNGRFNGLRASDIADDLKHKLGQKSFVPSRFPLNRKAVRRAKLVARPAITNGTVIVTDSIPHVSEHQAAPNKSATIRGVELTPVPPPLSGMKLGEPSAPNQVSWHPLLSQAGSGGLAFFPSSFAPRKICFLPFDASKDTNREPGRMPLTWYHLTEFMCGRVSTCLGQEFARFDHSKTSRSPAFDLQVVTRVLSVEGIQKKNVYGVDVDPSVGTMIAEFDCPADAWFFKGAAQDSQMPYSILMEIGLQTSGILTSVLKAPLTMNKDDILFRNLDASAEMFYVPDLRGKTIVNKTKCTGYSMMGAMGIHKFHFELFEKGCDKPFYAGDTSFGWFTPEVFETQAGLDSGVKSDCWHIAQGKDDLPRLASFDLRKDRLKLFGHLSTEDCLGRRSAQCEFLDTVDFISGSGKFGKGYAHGMKRVVKDDWFFSCHFWNDPVMPGSLGIESMLQALEMFCVYENIPSRFGVRAATFNSATGKTSWKYRGQLTPKNSQMDCEVHIKSIEADGKGGVVVTADGFLFVDCLRVYAATNLRMRIESSSENSKLSVPVVAVPVTVTTTTFTSASELKANLLSDLSKPLVLAGADGKAVEVFPCTPSLLGDRTFMETYGVDFPLYTGAMAKGIASADLVIACGKRKILSSLGAGGLPLHLIAKNLDKIQSELPKGAPFMVNLIHSPFNENLEKGCVDLLLERGVHFVEASAFMNVTIHVVRYRVKGLKKGGPHGVIATNRLIAKISRTELAEMFVRPAPEALVKRLLEQGDITAEQAELAKLIPLCDDIAVEADSGGHTDNRPLQVILPMIINVRNRVHKEFKYPRAFRVRVGAGGGIGCPQSVLAAFEMGAAFVVTGTINQMARQSGSSDIVRGQLSKATYSDITMAPAADMFDQGVQLQVLKKGTMFSARAKRLYELFVRYDSLDDIPAEERKKLEQQVFRKDIATIWKETAEYYINVLKDEAKIVQAGKDPKLKMSLVFRWYLGLSSTWANSGVADRATDYQVWCGPAIGAFNDFIRGTYLDPVIAGKFPDVAQINMQIFRGACYLQRVRFIQNNPVLCGMIDCTDSELASYRPEGEL